MSSETPCPPEVKLPQGTYRGRLLPSSRYQPKPLDVFLGIPYACSTAGENRFRPAKPLQISEAGSEAVVDATELGPISPHTDAGAAPFPVGEDCLSVNVTRPALLKDKNERLPVLVYIHGGAFNMGFGADRDLASFVAHSKRDVVAVSFNYRLGVLGFLALEGKGGKEGMNLGLGDQRLAMEWVKDNIAAFGGDPGKITTMGISAGGHSVGHHILSYTPQTAPFHRAILESGSATSRAVWYPSHSRQKTQLADFLLAAGVSPTEPDPLRALRALPVSDLTTAACKVWQKYAPSVRWPFQPVIDNATSIPDKPLSLWEKGAGLRIPVITGFCTNEGTSFVPPCHSSPEFRSFFTTLVPTLTEADLDLLEDLYPAPPAQPDLESNDPRCQFAAPPPDPNLGPHWRRLEAAYAHYAYVAPVLYTAHRLSLSPNPPPVYVYEFAALSPPLCTANHTDETPFVTHCLPELEPHRGLVDTSASMHAWFSDFVAGDGALEGWPVFRSPLGADGAGVGKIMVFGRGNDERVAAERGGKANKGIPFEVRTMSDREVEQIKFWWDRTALSQGFGERQE
ncbi:hypothetical protein jhhlp_002183 [Lomentospora prolificans]|uniref:Carboxylesterase type B domain-containing protein n=1 Tax=Lomentospora prolificans TaxID=41688 RepID=A0A2N3NDJ9_9PEZI|nr:hypothetical protein jhhlp_002183 [Lomentospora prolificans]